MKNKYILKLKEGFSIPETEGDSFVDSDNRENIER
jgi:hypothetical protein